MATRTLSQNSQFHTLVTLRKLDKEDKAELVKSITDGRISSSSGMTIEEMAKAIDMLQDEQMGSVKKMRSKILNIARDIFGLAPKEVFEQKHYDAVNTFLVNKFKRQLHKLSYDSLRDAVTAMEKWRDSSTKKMVNELLNGV